MSARVGNEQYRVQFDHSINGELQAQKGDIVERNFGPDYGCAAADSRRTGVPHVAVTHTDRPNALFFTIPRSKLEPIQ